MPKSAANGRRWRQERKPVATPKPKAKAKKKTN